jgi:hypothetical protein
MRAASVLNLHHLVRTAAISARATFLSPFLSTPSPFTCACGLPVFKVVTFDADGNADAVWTATCPRK